MEKKTRQLDEQVTKADREFFDSCKKSESARAEWDYNIGKVLLLLVVVIVDVVVVVVFVVFVLLWQLQDVYRVGLCRVGLLIIGKVLVVVVIVVVVVVVVVLVVL